MNKKGFTLLEILLVIGILGAILVVVSSFQTDVFKYNKSASDSLQNSQDARSIIRVMVRELRSAKQGDDGSYPITFAGTSTLSFYSDIDSDGVTEKVRYFISTTTDPFTLQKGIIKGSAEETFSILSYNIQNGTTTNLFEYSNNSSETAEIADIRMIKINLFNSKLYTSQVLLRNLKDI